VLVIQLGFVPSEWVILGR